MKPRDAALRVKQFEAGEKARKASDLERTIGEFEIMARDLDRQIVAEEDRTGIRDASHVSYSTYAKAAAQRRDNLRMSARELGLKLEAARREYDEALKHLAVAEDRCRRQSARLEDGLMPGPALRLREMPDAES